MNPMHFNIMYHAALKQIQEEEAILSQLFDPIIRQSLPKPLDQVYLSVTQKATVEKFEEIIQKYSGQIDDVSDSYHFDGRHLLSHAARCRNPEIVARIIELGKIAGKDLCNLRDKYEKTPLIWAAIAVNENVLDNDLSIKVMNVLIASGADLNAREGERNWNALSNVVCLLSAVSKEADYQSKIEVV